MVKSKIESVTEYIAAQPKAAQAPLRKVRAAIRKLLPGADEVISYRIPTYKVDGAVVVYFSGWKDHVSLYPVSERHVAGSAKERALYETNEKGTIRFPLAAPMPMTLIERIVKARVKEVAEEAKAKAKPRAKQR